MKQPRGLVLAALAGAALVACTSAADPSDGTPLEATATSPAERPRSGSSVEPAGSGAVAEDEAAGDEGTSRSGFHGKIDPLPPAFAAEMRGTTWKRGCPVPLDELRLLHFNYWSFAGEIERGPMVVNARVARDVLWVFERLFEARFPIKRVALATEFRPARFEQHRRITSHRSVTAAFNCRPVVTPLGPGDDYSQHAYGLAIDINPVQNPYVTAGGFVRNRAAERYLVRSRDLVGMIREGDVVVRSFDAIGWSWGGRWSGDKDYMHFSLVGG